MGVVVGSVVAMGSIVVTGNAYGGAGALLFVIAVLGAAASSCCPESVVSAAGSGASVAGVVVELSDESKSEKIRLIFNGENYIKSEKCLVGIKKSKFRRMLYCVKSAVAVHCFEKWLTDTNKSSNSK